jgi:glycosyltransferase involved in cell wall biosynthesis
MLKVMYDYQAFSMQKYGGISRYFFELMKHYALTQDVNVKNSILLSDNHYLNAYKSVKQYRFLSQFKMRGIARVIRSTNRVYSRIKLRYADYDVFHPTYYDPYFLNSIGDKPFVLTIHDMIHEKFPELQFKFDPTPKWKRKLAIKADKIITISENSKKDILECYQISEDKIIVIHHGAPKKIDTDILLNESLIVGDFILYVGSRIGYKNFRKFIFGIETIIKSNPNLNLLCAGGGNFTHDEITLFKSLNIENQIFQKNLNEVELAKAYSCAIVFVFPSLYEGFGLPILEAFLYDCPLVCSNTSSFPEIAGKAAEYFDPNSIECVKLAVKKVLNNSTRRNQLIELGREQLKKFSWEKTMRQTLAVYESVIK